MVGTLQTQAAGDAVQRAGQLLPQRVRRRAAGRRDLRPVAALRPLVGQLALVVGQLLADAVQQFAADGDLARTGGGVGDAIESGVVGGDAALVAAGGLLAARVVQHLV